MRQSSIKFLTCTILSTLFIMPAAARYCAATAPYNNWKEDNKFYVNGSGGASVQEMKGNFTAKSSFKPFGTVAIGARFNPFFSLELEGVYKKSSAENSRNFIASGLEVSYKSYGGLVNLLIYSEIFCYRQIQTFLGFGIGWGKNEATAKLSLLPNVVHSGSFNGIIGQIKAGAEYNVSDNWAITSDIRLLYLNKLRIPTIKKLNDTLQSIGVTLGIKFYI